MDRLSFDHNRVIVGASDPNVVTAANTNTSPTTGSNNNNLNNLIRNSSNNNNLRFGQQIQQQQQQQQTTPASVTATQTNQTATVGNLILSDTTKLAGFMKDDNLNKNDIAESRVGLTQAGLEEYSRSYYDTNAMYNHQKQSSYAQSEGYHSYVSSLDSSSTPFLDRLRQDSELIHSRNLSWSQDYVSVAGSSNLGDNSPESSSSTETLKWLGSMSDLSVISHATSNSAISEVGAQNPSPSQLIVHSSRVRTPQRHNSESVLFMKDETQAMAPSIQKTSPIGNGPSLGIGPISNHVSTSSLDAILDETMRHQTQSTGLTRSSDRSSRRNNSRLFPINTYTEMPKNAPLSPNTGSQTQLDQIQKSPTSPPAWQSVADRINEIEKNANNPSAQPFTLQQQQKYTFLDPAKTQLVSNAALKAVQKNAIQSYFERQQSVRESISRSKSVNQSIAYSKPVVARPHSLNMSSNMSTSMKNLQRSSMSGMMSPPDGLMQHSKPLTAKNSSIKSPVKDSFDPRNVINRIAAQIIGNEMKSDEIPPTPPPRNRAPIPVRRTSSAAEYSSMRDKVNQSKQNLSKDLLGPMIMGPIISLDDWVPERPPKNPTLRIPSPELPPPPVPIVNEQEALPTFDEPLPPPPDEVLRHVRQHSEVEAKHANTPSRRNSFAGHSTRIVRNPYYEPAHIASVSQPGLHRTNGFDARASHHNFTTTTTSHHHAKKDGGRHQAQRVILDETPQSNKVSMRKRAHNMQNTVGLPTTMQQQQQTPPPPLKPRMSGQHVHGPQVIERSTSKATYLPRQTHDKHQLSDPDHGSYKLKLTSNEDCINHDQSTTTTTTTFNNGSTNNLSNNNKCNNLPDVLPLAVKYNGQQQQQQQRYFSVSPPSSKQKAVPQSAPVISTSNLKSLFNFTKLNTQVAISDELTKVPPSAPATIITSPKYTSQSVFDLVANRNDDPPPYTDEIKKELVQHLELQLNSSPQIIVPPPIMSPPAPVIIRKSPEKLRESPVKDLSPPSTPEKRLSNCSSEPPSYEETQQNSSYPGVNTTSVANVSSDSEKSDTEERLTTPPLTTTTTSETQTDEDSNIERITTTSEESTTTEIVKKTNFIQFVSRKISPEELDCDNLSKDLVSQLSPLDKLHSILVPPKTFRQSSDYVSELFNINISSRPAKKDASTITTNEIADEPKINGIESVTTSTTYCTETTLEIDNGSLQVKHYNREMTLISNDHSDLTKKKEELVERLGKKLQVLSNEQTQLTEESAANEILGEEVLQKVTQKVKPSEASRYRSYVDDVGYITKLLLSLSGRLAKTHNSLQNMDDTNVEKKPLETKRDRLLSQLEEAKNLKENIDKRGLNVAKLLEKSLTLEEYADYDYFIHMKAKLLVDSAEIANKIKLGEEQLSALKETLVHSEC